MQIPLSYADAVIGTQGSSISYIRRVSGATVTIQESRGIPGDMTVEISGTASQVQTAQQMIQVTVQNPHLVIDYLNEACKTCYIKTCTCLHLCGGVS